MSDHRVNREIQEWRRLQAVELDRLGWLEVDIAEALGVHKGTRERRALVFVDESGFYLLPGVVKTYGPKGKTPVIDKWLTRDHLSVMGGLTLIGKLYTLVRPEALTSEHAVIFLERLLRHTG